jgi:hypothetical protein
VTASISSRLTPQGTDDATASPQDTASVSSSACRGAVVLAQGWDVCLLGVAVLMAFEMA